MCSAAVFKKILTIPFTIILTSTGPIFVKFARLVERTTAVDDQYEISFSILRGTLMWQAVFVGFTQRIESR